MAGISFDDLVPKQAPAQSGLTFDDLVPPAAPAQAPKPVPNTLTDVLQSFVSGIPRGLSETAMLPVTAQRALDKYATPYELNYVVNPVRGLFGYDPLKPKDVTGGAVQDAVGGAQDAIRAKREEVLHQPQTGWGRAAGTVGEFVQPGILTTGVEKGLGAALSRFATEAVVPGLASEGAGRMTEGTALEPYARVAGALAGNAAMVLPKAYNTPETVLRRAVGPAEDVDWTRALQLQDNATGIKLTGPEAIAHAQGGATALPDLLRVVEGSLPGRQALSPFFAARQGQVDTAVNNLLDLIAPQSAKPTELGPTVAKAAEAALQKGPEGQAVADAVFAAGPRTTDMQAGQVIQPALNDVFSRREGMRNALGDQDYAAARRAEPTIPVDDLRPQNTVKEPGYTRLDPAENPITGSPEMASRSVPPEIQTPSMTSNTGPDHIQVDARSALREIDRLRASEKGSAAAALDNVRNLLFTKGGVDTSVAGLENARHGINGMIDEAKAAGGQNHVVERLERARDALDAALETSPEYAAANRNFAAASEPLAPFENTGAGKVIARDKFNERFTMPPENVPGALNAPSELANFKSVAPPEALDAMQNNVATKLLDQATDANGNVSVDKLRLVLRQNEDVLGQMPAVRDRIMAVADSAGALDNARATTQLGRMTSAGTTETAGATLLPKNPHVGSEGEAADMFRRITAENPEASSQLLRQELADRYAQAAKDTQSGSHETAGIKFRNAVAGSQPQDAVLNAILNNLPSNAAAKAAPELLDVLQATGRRKAIGSATDFNTAIRGDLSVNSTMNRFVDVVRSLGTTFVTNTADRAKRYAYGKSLDSLAEIFTDPNSVERIREAMSQTPSRGFAEVLARTGKQAGPASRDRKEERR